MYTFWYTQANLNSTESSISFGLRRAFRSPNDSLPSYTSYNLTRGRGEAAQRRGERSAPKARGGSRVIGVLYPIFTTQTE